jgi:spore coat polysaccharide biosynthesis protein SpsF (cytidylyltransferase family)
MVSTKANTGVIIQARLASTRLPQKVIAPIWNDKSLLDILIIRLKKLTFKSPLVLATGDQTENKPLELIAHNHGIQFFCGSENDVLGRFVACAEKFGFSKVLRVCADNPFLDIHLTDDLLIANAAGQEDYVGYSVSGLPAILSHYGFFTELISVDALRRVQGLSTDKLDHEHISRFLYNHPNNFSIKWVEVPLEISEAENIRLTVDTKEDFQLAGSILEELQKEEKGFEYGYADVLSAVKKLGPTIANKMKEQIFENSKS